MCTVFCASPRHAHGEKCARVAFAFGLGAAFDTHRAMTDRITTDSLSAAPPAEQGLDARPHTAAARAPKKPRRPRPTFEDGALTRVFKFPSKSYPRSSYYVTADEIIIRIKKARKKWKMTIPKKRVVSYRTNRWFAKPRWIAIELTFTQAVKLGLAEARPRAPETVPPVADATAVLPAAADLAALAPPSATAMPGHSDPGAAALEAPCAEAAAPEPHEVPDAFAVIAGGEPAAHLEAETDDLDDGAEQDGADHFELALDTDDAESAEPDADEIEPEAGPQAHDAVAVREPEPSAPPVPEPSAAEAPAARSGVPEAPREAVVVPFAPAPQPQPKPHLQTAPSRRRGRQAIATLAAAVAGYAIWAAIDTRAPMLPPGCAPQCGSPIVTGALGPAGAPQLPLAPPEIDPPLSPSEVAAVARTELDAQARSDAAAASEAAAPASASPEAVALLLPERDFVLPLSPPVIMASVDVPKPVAVPRPACETLGAAAR